MSDDPIRRYLRERGSAAHVVAGGVEGLVLRWEETAAAVSAGYALTLDDYLNDLDGRQILEDVMRSMPPADGGLARRIGRADALMRAATVPAGRCVWGDDERPGRDPVRSWWYFVVPGRPGEDLVADLRVAGLPVGAG